MSFDSLGLSPVVLASVRQAGFSEPTPVQAQAIPAALAGADLMVSAQTGSGKTAAFMLPALHKLSHQPAQGGRGVQVLVLTPTRELAMQVSEASAVYGAQIKGLHVATVVGGMPYGAQLKALSRRVDVLVATPGRLIDHLKARRVDLSTVKTLVLDEADRMLDMGFIEDIEEIVSRTPADRQTLLFSATLDGSVAGLARGLMRDPKRIEVSSGQAQHANITQSVLYADDGAHKRRLLDHILRDSAIDQAIVFTATKRGADDLTDQLNEQGLAAMALHGDMNQRQRTRTIESVQRGRTRILVATDVAARGIDVQAISHAINFDLPMQAEDYVHRIGRTGRAGREGLAITLAEHRERFKVRRIEHFIGHDIPTATIAGLEPRRADARPSGGGARRGNGGGKSGYGGGKPGFGARPGRGAGKPYEGRSDKPFEARGESRPSRPIESRSEDRPARSFEGAAGKPFEHRERSSKPFEGRAPREDRSGFGARINAPRGAYSSDRGDAFAATPARSGARPAAHAPSGFTARPSARPTARPTSRPGANAAGRPTSRPTSRPGARSAGRPSNRAARD